MELKRLIDPQFQTALRKLASQDLPLKSAFLLKGIIKQVTDELNKYDEVRNEALKKYGTKNEDGTLQTENGSVQFTPDNLKEFSVEMENLIGCEVMVGTISINDLGDKATLTTSDLLQLDGVVRE